MKVNILKHFLVQDIFNSLVLNLCESIKPCPVNKPFCFSWLYKMSLAGNEDKDIMSSTTVQTEFIIKSLIYM